MGKQENQLDGTRWWEFVLRVAEELEIDRFGVYISEMKWVEFVDGLNMKGRKLGKKGKPKRT